MTILIPQNDLVDVAFHGAGAVGQGEPGGDGLLVAADAVGEGVQLGLVVGLDPGEPVFECEQALAAGHHLGETADVAGQGVQVRAAGRDGGEPGLVFGVKAVRAGQQPAGDLAGLRDWRGCRGLPGIPAGPGPPVGGAELADVAFDGLHAAGPALGGGHFGVQGGGADDALVPSLVDVRLERVQPAFPAGGLDQQPGGTGLAGEPVHGVPAQPQDLGGLPLGAPGLQQLVHGGVALEGARYQGPLAAADVPQPVRPGRAGVRELAGRRVFAPGGRLIGGAREAAAVRDDRLLGVFAQVVPQMPAIGDLDRARRPRLRPLSVGPGPVPADDLRTGTGLQPCLQGGGLPVGQQVHDLPGFRVGYHGAVDPALAQREVIDPGDLGRGGDRRVGQRHDQPQHGGGMDRHAQGAGQPGGGPPGQLQPEAGQHAQQRHAAPPVPLRQAPGLLGERGLRARGLQAAEPAHRQRDQHRPAAGRTIGHHPRIPAVNPPGHRPAGRAPRLRRPAARPDHHRVPGVLHLAYPQPAKVREQHEQQLLALSGNLQDTAGGGRPRGRHGRLKRQRGSRGKRSWQTSASYRSLVARSRRHAARPPDRHIPRHDQPPQPGHFTYRDPSQNSRKSQFP